MRRSILKKISAVAIAAVLTIGSATSCFAANWESYWGQNQGWYEGALGETTSTSDDGWVAYYEQLGWGGIWGAQIFDKSINVPAGEEYNLKFTLSSTDCDKWVFIKLTNEDTSSGDQPVLFGDWVKVPAGGSIDYDKTFTVDADATQIFFGIGGELGDRPEQGIYDYASEIPNDVDPMNYTTLTMTNYSLAAVADGETVTTAADPETPTGPDPETTTAPGSTNNTVVQTGDFSPIAFGVVAIIAASAVVVFTRKREDA